MHCRTTTLFDTIFLIVIVAHGIRLAQSEKHMITTMNQLLVNVTKNDITNMEVFGQNARMLHLFWHCCFAELFINLLLMDNFTYFFWHPFLFPNWKSPLRISSISKSRLSLTQHQPSLQLCFWISYSSPFVVNLSRVYLLDSTDIIFSFYCGVEAVL